MSPRPDYINFDAHESNRLLACLSRARELGREHDNLDVVAMAEELVDLIIEKWEERLGA
jgi:hypothetical protein